MKAVYKDQIIAEAQDTLVVEGKHYFPQNSVNLNYLTPSEYCQECPWKGAANFYDLDISGEKLPNAAWYYPNPKEAAIRISGYIAFGEHIQLVS